MGSHVNENVVRLDFLILPTNNNLPNVISIFQGSKTWYLLHTWISKITNMNWQITQLTVSINSIRKHLFLQRTHNMSYSIQRTVGHRIKLLTFYTENPVKKLINYLRHGKWGACERLLWCYTKISFFVGLRFANPTRLILLGKGLAEYVKKESCFTTSVPVDPRKICTGLGTGHGMPWIMGNSYLDDGALFGLFLIQ